MRFLRVAPGLSPRVAPGTNRLWIVLVPAWLVLILTLGLTAPVRAQDTAEELYQAGLYQEEVQGNLQQAIDLFGRILVRFPDDRGVGARAQLHIGLCYEKLGRQEAQQAYRRVIADFPEHAAEVATARNRLAALEEATTGVGAEPSGGIALRQLIKWPYGDAFPYSVTPDGTGIVYWEDDGNLEIRDLRTGSQRILVRDSTLDASGAAVSPDGRFVSYRWAEPATISLRVVSVDGSGSRVLYRQEGCPVSHKAWTSDSREIMAVVGCSGDTPEVLRIDVTSGRSQVVARVEGAESIALSSDDQLLAFTRGVAGDDGNFDIWALPLTGGREYPLVRHPANDRVLGFIPGSSVLLFLSDRDGTMDAWAVETSLQGVEGPPRLVQRNIGPVGVLGFTRGGNFVFSSYKRWFSAGIAPFNLDGGTADLEAGQDILGSNIRPAWAPEGERLAFVPELDGPQVGKRYRRPLHVYDIGSGTTRELASSFQTRNPRWSPDGQSILFCAWDTLRDAPREGEGGLYVVDVGSGEIREVVDLDPATRASFAADLSGVWSHNGDAIIYAVYDFQAGQGRLVWRDLESGEERELYRDPRLTTRLLDVSPDGGRLLFALRSEPRGYTSGIHSGGSLMVMDLASGEMREIHRVPDVGGERVYSLQWAPDGRHVFFTKRGDDHRTWIWRVPVSGGPAERLWSFEGDHFDGYIQLSPDGRQVAYTVYHQEQEVWVMEGLRALLVDSTGK